MRGFTIGTIITIGSGNQPDTPGESDISGRSDAQRQCSASPGKALIDDPEEQLFLSCILSMPDDTDAALYRAGDDPADRGSRQDHGRAGRHTARAWNDLSFTVLC